MTAPPLAKRACLTPTQLPTHPNLHRPPPRPLLLPWDLVLPPPRPRPPLRRPQLAHPLLRHLPRRTPLVPDALVRLRHRPLRARVSADPYRRGPSLPLPVAVAGRTGRAPGPWLRHSSPADADAVPRRRDAVRESGLRQRDSDPGQGDQPDQCQPRGRLSEFWTGGRRGAEEAMVLGRLAESVAYLRRVCQGFSQRAAFQALIGGERGVEDGYWTKVIPFFFW
jgi:hypothetical protein